MSPFCWESPVAAHTARGKAGVLAESHQALCHLGTCLVPLPAHSALAVLPPCYSLSLALILLDPPLFPHPFPGSSS